MTELAAGWLGVLADWSLRWGVLIFGLVVVFAVRSPRAVAVRLCLLRLVLVGGLLLPLAPRWWNVSMPMGPIGPMGPMAATSEPIGAAGDWYPPRAVAESLQVEPAVAPRQTIRWQMLVAGAWLAGCGFCLVRIAAGRWWLVRIRRAATPISGELLRELQEVHDELGVRRPVEFLMSRRVAGPAVFGGWRPAVVVPIDWATLPAEDRRTALLHELAHVAHADDWAGLAEEFVRAGFFFHPLVHWLLGRLTREREQRCDTVVVRHGIAPRSLALVLLDSAKRLGPGRSMLAPAAAIPMFHQSSVKERIHQLLEADMTRWSKPLSKLGAALATLVVLGCCVGLGGFGATAAAPQMPTLPQTPPTPVVDLGDQPPAAGPARPLHGTVTDKDGHPISGATILAVVDMGPGERVTTTSDAQGRFAFDAFPPSETAFPSVFVVALRDGFAAAGTCSAQSVTRPVTLVLLATGVFRGVVKDSDGRPVAGADVQVGHVYRQFDSTGSYGFSLYWPAAAIRGTAAELSHFATSDATGGFQFPQLPVGDEIMLRVTAKGFAELDTRGGTTMEPEHVVEANAKPAELVLQPEAVIRGRVTTQVGGLPPTTATVQLEGVETLHGFRRTVRPDADGRFTADGLPAGPISIALILPLDAPATALGQSVTTSFGKTNEVALEMIPGVEVTGRVQVQGTREPVAGVQMETFGLINPDAPLYHLKPTDADGQFRLRLPAGRVQLSVLNLPPGYTFANREHREIEIPANATTFRIPAPFEVVKVKKD